MLIIVETQQDANEDEEDDDDYYYHLVRAVLWKVLRKSWKGGSGWRRANRGSGEAIDRLAVKDQSEKQRQISNGPESLATGPRLLW